MTYPELLILLELHQEGELKNLPQHQLWHQTAVSTRVDWGSSHCQLVCTERIKIGLMIIAHQTNLIHPMGI